MSLLKINDVELEVDMGDIEFSEKYENALLKMGESEKELQNVGYLSDFFRNYCQLFYTFFDNVFGEGTGERIFHGKYNVKTCEDTYFSFLECCSKQVDEINRSRAANFKKYKVKNKK